MICDAPGAELRISAALPGLRGRVIIQGSPDGHMRCMNCKSNICSHCKKLWELLEESGADFENEPAIQQLHLQGKKPLYSTTAGTAATGASGSVPISQWKVPILKLPLPLIAQQRMRGELGGKL